LIKDNVIITGGAGFIGTNLALSAIKKGYRVIIFDNLSRAGSDNNLNAILPHQHNVGELHRAADRGQLVKGDIRSKHDVKRLLEAYGSRCYAVFHLAAQTAVTTSLVYPEQDFEQNAWGTFNILNHLRQIAPEVPFIYASTNKVYGALDWPVERARLGNYYWKQGAANPLEEAISELQPLDPATPYGVSKACGGQYVLDFAQSYGIRAVDMRQSCIYGPYQYGAEAQGWLAWLTIAAVYDLPITVFGSGLQKRDVLWVEDLVAAYWAAVENIDKAAGQTYNIGGGWHNTLSVLQLLELLSKKLGKVIPAANSAARPSDQKIYVSDIRKAKRDLGWEPTVAPDVGVDRLVRWVQGNRNLFVKAGVLNT
jgi:CDP-paratose 2-epimerase